MNVAQKKAGFFETLLSFNRAFWFANVIELGERWAYYGVRGGIAVYIVAAGSLGGLEFTHLQKANIFLWWAACQAFLPTFTGGYADRYGYKKTVAFSVSLTVVGYVLMGFLRSYHLFFFACMVVATGTALFKPGIQGILATSTTKKNAPLGWSFFYMIVNIGGFVGPLLSGYLRLMTWKYVFITSALIHSLNLLVLLFFKEPVIERHIPVGPKSFKSFIQEFFAIFVKSIKHILEPRLAMFLIIFSGFWLMFMQLFDLLPNYITDWVDTSSVSIVFGNLFNNASWIEYGTSMQQLPAEWLINLDAFAIIFLMLPIGWVASRFMPVSAMVIGILIATFGLVFAGYTMNPWLCAIGIFIFAIGEMIASPRKSEYLSLIAPPDKKGLYMGYVNFPVGIGWMLGSKIAGPLYQYNGDKVTLAKNHMINVLNMPEAFVNAIPKERVVTTLAEKMGLANAWEATGFLFKTYHPERIWFVFAAIGLFSMLGMLLYNLFIEKKRVDPL